MAIVFHSKGKNYPREKALLSLSSGIIFRSEAAFGCGLIEAQDLGGNVKGTSTDMAHPGLILYTNHNL